ncbi:c-type cytochrome [Aromatoleum toluclasticum]|uniref:c-type cytochrome n=1 Tax=Aromatoleum toluclasticum TaxID=92003 RepID=UPI00036500C7|nr:c-type cytochrome [Aromatoleum toluclasticum]MCC4116617.1 c-type cytochrome [Aromatoleum toluclasticum]
MIKAFTLSAVALTVLLSACGRNETPAPAAPAAPPAPATSPAPAAPATEAPANAAPSAAVAAAGGNASGSSTYNKVCVLCHAAGVGGAPKPGDKADWGPRIGQGKDVLYKHALEGFTGQKGMMPPRGGSPALKDDEVKAAVDFMVSKSE